MKNLLLLVAVGCLTLVLASPAQAQFYPNVYNPAYPSGYSGYSYQNNLYSNNFNWNSNYGYNSGYGYNRGHFDVVPGGIVTHYGHFHYVQPHVDYHIGNRRYEVIPTPFGSTISPYPHRHR